MNSLESPPKERKGRHFPPPARKRRMHLELLESVALIHFDHPDKAANIIDEAFFDELETALRAVRRLQMKGLVFLSSKPAVFIAGADLSTLGSVRGDALAGIAARGQRVFLEIAELGIPTIAAIHGACLGGGFELALACDRRIASDDSRTTIGLPEVQLGILPAWGGSTRLPRLIGLPKALDHILKGKPAKPKQALRLGMIDEVVPRERLRERALALLAKPAPERRGHALVNNPITALILRILTKRRLLKQTRGHYPAPLLATDVVTRGASGSVEKSLERERAALVTLADTPAAKNLMRLFFLQETAKRIRFDESVDLKSLTPISRTAVVGAGVMGSGIAQTFAAKGLSVILSDIDATRVAAGMKQVHGLFNEATRRRIMSKHEVMRGLDLVSPTASSEPLHRCDFVVEAAIEDLAIKKRIFADLCARTSRETLLATNTSALPIHDLALADGVTHPERILGLHFFNPVSRMKLVEVIVTGFTAPEAVERALALVRALGKTPVVVKDSPGFLVNRVLMPYLIEAGRLAGSGVPVEHIDEALLDFGMPMGPLRLLDEIGLDVAAHVATTMSAAFGERFAIPTIPKERLEAGALGKKSGSGFYRYENGKETPEAVTTREPARIPSEEIAARLVDLMRAEAQHCLDEGVVRSADDIDLAMILGTGFPPFRGSLLSPPTHPAS